MAGVKKNRMFRLDDDDFALLGALAEKIALDTGLPVKRADVVRLAVREKAAALGVKQPEPVKKSKRS
jgi:hypothetical protein